MLQPERGMEERRVRSAKNIKNYSARKRMRAKTEMKSGKKCRSKGWKAKREEDGGGEYKYAGWVGMQGGKEDREKLKGWKEEEKREES